jgi:murein endopeptidase
MGKKRWWSKTIKLLESTKENLWGLRWMVFLAIQPKSTSNNNRKIQWTSSKLNLLFTKGHDKENEKVGTRWLTLVILATQEAEIRRIVVRSQSGQIVSETLTWTHYKKWLVEHSKCRPWVQTPVLQNKQTNKQINK